MNKHLLRRIGLGIIDYLFLVLIFFVCFFITNDFRIKAIQISLLLAVFGEVFLKIFILVLFKNYKYLLVYRDKHDFFRLTLYSLLSNLFILGLVLIINTFYYLLPMNVLIFSLCVEMLYFLFSRLMLSIIYRVFFYKKPKKEDVKRKTLIIGAGQAGELIYNEIRHNSNLHLDVIGFLDDDKNKIGCLFCNKRVMGPILEMNSIVEAYDVTDIIIAIPSAPKEVLLEIVNRINYKNMNVMILPSMSKILSGGLEDKLRKVDISDLLGRKTIELDRSGLMDFIKGKTLLVTGGGGSIGSEICRQILQYQPSKLVIFDIYENTTYELLMEINILYEKNPLLYHPEIISLIGSVRDRARLEEVFSSYKPNIVFHAAAHKHVPLMEDSPKEAIKNNVVGTYNVCDMAQKYHADKMVLISTDKAVNPTNVMGASKRFAEMVMEAFENEQLGTHYSMVRFGNVLGSHGSVIPLFEAQIASGGPLTVTSKEINRFFMTIPEACSLVIQAGEYAKGGETFILDMGQPVKIIDLARKMIKLSGLEEGKDIEIKITGLRPGEKIYEELLLDTKKAYKTENNKIFVEKNGTNLSIGMIEDLIGKIKEVWNENKAILDLLKETEEKIKRS